MCVHFNFGKRPTGIDSMCLLFGLMRTRRLPLFIHAFRRTAFDSYNHFHTHTHTHLFGKASEHTWWLCCVLLATAAATAATAVAISPVLFYRMFFFGLLICSVQLPADETRENVRWAHSREQDKIITTATCPNTEHRRIEWETTTATITDKKN